MDLKKSAKIFLKILTNIGSNKMAGKESAKFFEDSHEYREQKNGGKKRAKNFL